MESLEYHNNNLCYNKMDNIGMLRDKLALCIDPHRP